MEHNIQARTYTARQRAQAHKRPRETVAKIRHTPTSSQAPPLNKELAGETRLTASISTDADSGCMYVANLALSVYI